MPSLGLPIYGQKQGAGLDARRWRSVEEAAEAREVPPGEFPDDAAAVPEGFTRRGFLQVLGASVALAGLEACKPPRENVVSYVRPPAGVTPSVPSAYATVASRGGYAVGLVVTSHEGRPTKIEGNREHPSSRGGSDAMLQASILDLYDPRRLKGFTRAGRPLGLATVLREVSALARSHAQDGGARLRFLVEPTSSPAVADLRRRILERFPKARFDAWAPVGADAGRAGAALAFGKPLDASASLADADVILSLESDFLALEGDSLRLAREFGARRTAERMNRLYVAESAYTVTGGAADHRFRMRSADVLGFGRAVAAELAAKHGLSQLAPLGAPAGGERAKAAAAVAADLAKARGRSVVLAGDRQPAAVHALAAALNDALGNAGKTVAYRPTALLDPAAGPDRLRALASELEAGKVDALVVTAWNPAHTAPADVPLRKLLPKAKDTIALALREDDTVRAATWKIAATHPLEAWGDLRAADGTASIQQPLIAPLHESMSELELLAAFLDEGDHGSWRIVREGWRRRAGAAGFDGRWDGWLAAGVVAGSAVPPEAVQADLGRVAEAVRAVPAPGAGLELGFAADYKVLDGRFLENAWLQEYPHPVTKLTWDNAAQLSAATAKQLGVASGDLVELSWKGRTLTAPALVVPGHADGSVLLTLGYGQAVAGPVGKGVGHDAYALRTSDAPWFGAGVEVRKTGKRHALATTQEHFSMQGRAIALALDAPELAHAKHELDEHRGPQPTIHEPVDYSKNEYRWGMAIDLSRCIGCGACTVACQAENNIPVVGKEQVLRSREMHWLRVDRYFEGPVEDPASVSQPLACVHCEAAPCEYVCPVNATVHSEEGLNEMVYNRCVGTRYCSNNCPYKVRRFNWLDWHGTLEPTEKMVHNPDVTVRARGVMEKCTYCTQRIEHARIDARSNGRKIGGDEVVSACQQACPTEAIVFGNLNDPGSAVSRRHADARRYDLLHELGTRPRTAYLVKLRNPNPDLA
ncbi:Fe-S-cluster-containing hydrogenase [Anaeromyxobacter sp. PSR-1]|uniref:Fe-S-cluster-containing hydrogenase n=1 Tax=Anaeromyxobacter sp. PSR-1 TaxID=1300915 RepID=UPI0005E7EC7C|nr:Fe-S-cluster-containing hydrogenase [Anaeromyxobacter sp. PSR-1]GAO02024.1 putative dimethyl sulfoxide reductase iron-sulfur subunit B [Anaeromyxobacter sp. PSR-1]